MKSTFIWEREKAAAPDRVQVLAAYCSGIMLTLKTTSTVSKRDSTRNVLVGADGMIALSACCMYVLYRRGPSSSLLLRKASIVNNKQKKSSTIACNPLVFFLQIGRKKMKNSNFSVFRSLLLRTYHTYQVCTVSFNVYVQSAVWYSQKASNPCHDGSRGVAAYCFLSSCLLLPHTRNPITHPRHE